MHRKHLETTNLRKSRTQVTMKMKMMKTMRAPSVMIGLSEIHQYFGIKLINLFFGTKAMLAQKKVDVNWIPLVITLN